MTELLTLYLIKGILVDVLKCLGDNKKHMRECTLNTLDSWVGAVQLDKMVCTDPKETSENCFLLLAYNDLRIC